MKLLLDAHVLLWAAGEPKKLSRAARRLLLDPKNSLMFSAASIWEIASKKGLGRADFQLDPARLRRGLIDNGYEELAVSSAHAVAIGTLPALHKDPFDRILVAQALVEGIALATADEQVAQYRGSAHVLLV